MVAPRGDAPCFVGRCGVPVDLGDCGRGRRARILASPTAEAAAARARRAEGGSTSRHGSRADEHHEHQSSSAFFVDAVFILNAVTQTEANEGIVAVSLARAAKLKRLVYMSVQNLNGAPHLPHLPHFGSKIGVEAAVKASKIPYTILQPNNFFHNDVWFKDVLLGYGVYPQPLGSKGLHRVDARDIADAAVNALTATGFENKTYVLAGPTVVNGNSTAEVWSSKLGKKITYGGDDLDAWAKAVSAMMPGWMVYDMRMMYAEFQENGLLATASELADCEKVVGHPLRTYDAFAEELAKSWK